MSDIFHYDLYGLRLSSQIELPELARLPDTARKVDVEILNGKVPDTLEGGVKVKDYAEVAQDTCTYTVKDVARYFIDRGKRITVEPAPGVDMIDVRFYFFGTIIGALLHQRGLFPLHISAIRTPAGVMAFTAASGGGKSTIVNELRHRTGWPLLTDDIAVIHPERDPQLLHCGMLRMKLWRDAVERSGFAASALTRDTTRADKFHLSDPDLFTTEPLAMRKLFHLEVGETVSITPMDKAATFSLVMNTIYRPDLAAAFGDGPQTMARAAKVAGALDAYTLARPWSEGGLGDSVDKLIKMFGVASDL